MSPVHNRINGRSEAGEQPGRSSDRPDAEGPAAGTTPHGAPGDRQSNSAPQESPLDPLRADLAELATSAAHYVTARRDLLAARARSALFWICVALGAACVTLAAAAMAVVMILQGVALALAELLGGRLWAGQLLTGTAVLLVFSAAVWFVFQESNRHWQQRVMAKYEHYKQRERAARERSDRRAAERDGS